MLPTRNKSRKSINSLSFCLTALANSAYLNKFHNFRPNKCYILPLSEISENISFPLTGVSWSKSVSLIAERPANPISGITWYHSKFIIIIISNFTSGNRFLKVALDLLFKPSNFVPGLIPRPDGSYTYIYYWYSCRFK